MGHVGASEMSFNSAPWVTVFRSPLTPANLIYKYVRFMNTERT